MKWWEWLLVGLLIYEALTLFQKRKPKHEHDWVPVRVSRWCRYGRDSLGKVDPTRVIEEWTKVQRRCACGETSTIQLDGEWTLDDLKPTPKEVVEGLLREEGHK